MTLTVGRLEHVNIRTANLEVMIDWYGNMLDMHPGPRPNFDFPGAWLYVGDAPFIHLVGVSTAPSTPQNALQLEHFAFSATGLATLLGKAQKNGIEVGTRRVPGFPLFQANLRDPDGNHLHIDFDIAEADALELT